MSAQHASSDDRDQLIWRYPRSVEGEVGEHPVDADERVPVLAHLGVRIAQQSDPTDPTAIAEMDLRDDLRNLAGYLQGGMVATLLDVAAGVAAARASSTDHVLTQDLDIRYLRPVKAGPARATGRVMRAGKRSLVVAVELTDRGAADPDEICSFATCTLAIVGRTPLRA